MGYIQGADRNQVILLPDVLDDYVGEDNEVRAIDAFIDSLDISSMGFKSEPAKEGRPGYAPRDILKLYMYGYLNHIRSSRRLQKEASRNVELMWLLRKVVPDFRCIADFRKDNAKAIKEVFKAFVKLCNAAGLHSHESVVIDGSKFRAVNADNKSYVSSNTTKVLLDVEEKINQYMKELDDQMVFRLYCRLHIEARSNAVPRLHKAAFRISGADLIFSVVFQLHQCCSKLRFPTFQIIQYSCNVFFC